MDREKTLHLRTVLLFGLEVQKLFPQIAEEYTKSTATMKKLARKYKIASRFKIKFATAVSVIQKAIKGYNGVYTSIRDVQSYAGLLSKETVKEIADKHQDISRIKNGKKQTREHKGIHAQTPDERMISIRNALIARGIQNPPALVPFLDPEKKRVRELYDSAICRKRTKVYCGKIAECINQELYSKELALGTRVRTGRSISSLIQRMKKNREWLPILKT